jgi:hypothetical protein
LNCSGADGNALVQPALTTAAQLTTVPSGTASNCAAKGTFQRNSMGHEGTRRRGAGRLAAEHRPTGNCLRALRCHRDLCDLRGFCCLPKHGRRGRVFRPARFNVEDRHFVEC